MGFDVTFYKFNKEGNSTKRPSSGGNTYNCKILRGSSIISPTIELSLGYSTAPDFNYAYIPNFGRYYYVGEWTYNDALWTAQLEVDALATYRTEIGSENLYALRTSNSSLYDGRIVDNLYPTKAGCTFNKTAYTSPWADVTNGVFMVGIVGTSPEYGAISYYTMTSNNFDILVSSLLSDNFLENVVGLDLADASIELQKSLIDPLQFIKSCVYIPATAVPGQLVTSIDVFGWPVPASATKLPKASPYRTENAITITLPKHPQTSSRGNYVNLAPYTMQTISIPPFGIIDLDTTITCNAVDITIQPTIDMVSGLGIIEISCNSIIMNRVEAQIGIPIQLSQITRDYIGATTSAVGGIAGAIGNFLSGNIGGAIAGGVSAIGETTKAIQPRAQSIGSGGSYSQLYTECALYTQFFEVTDDDIAKNGRPCCKIVNCSAGGYFLIQDGDVPISGTKAEWQMVKDALEGGFYWE